MSSGFFGGGIGPTAIKRRGGLTAPVPIIGAELLTNGGFEGTYVSGVAPGWSCLGTPAEENATIRSGISAQKCTGNAGEGPLTSISAKLTPAAWYAASAWARAPLTLYLYFQIWDGTTMHGVATTWGSAGVWVERKVHFRATNTGNYFRILSGATAYVFYVDDASLKPITLSSLFSTRPYASANCDLSAAVTRTAGTQAGFVARLDSATSPANFIIAYLDGAGNVKVDKCVGGTYTNVISGAVTYGAAKILRLVCSGNNVSAYYDGTQVGSTVTVSDAGIVSNTRHGLFSTYAANSFAGYVAA